MDKVSHMMIMAVSTIAMQLLLLRPRGYSVYWTLALLPLGLLKEVRDWWTHPSFATEHPEWGRMLLESSLDSLFNFLGIMMGVVLVWVFFKRK